MALRGIRYYLIISLFVIAASAKYEDSEWLESDEDSTPNTTTRVSRRTTTATWDFISRTRKSTTLLPRTKYAIPTLSTEAAVSTTIRSAAVPSPAFIPTNFTGTLITLLQNFVKFTTSDHPSLLEDDGKEYFVSVLKLEVFTMASGNHFVIVPAGDEKVEQTLRRRAGGVSELWLDLFCTEDIDAILNNVTLETVVQYQQKSVRTQPLTVMNKLQEMLRTLFSKLNDAIEEDSFLSTMYTAKQVRYAVRSHIRHTTTEQKVYIPLNNITQGKVDDRMLEAWLNHLDTRKFLIHQQFLDMRSESRGEISNENEKNGAWVRSFLKVAREPGCIEKMQKIYTVALNETAKNFATRDFPRATLRVFVDKLTEAVEADNALKSEWMKQKNAGRGIVRTNPKRQKTSMH